MDSANTVSLSMFTGESLKYITLFNFFVYGCTSSLVQDQLTAPIPFVLRYVPYIVATPLEMMGSILSVKMSSSDKMCSLSDLSNITVDPSESIKNSFEDSNLEDGMCHILSFENLQKTKGPFLVWPFRDLFLDL